MKCYKQLLDEGVTQTTHTSPAVIRLAINMIVKICWLRHNYA